MTDTRRPPTSIILIGLAIGMAIYSPISHYVFETTWGELFSRVYFTFGGAGIVLWARS